MSNTFDWDVDTLSPTQKKIADFIEKNTERLPYLTERDIALEVPTSIASVSRFWRAVGYTNLKEFKKSMYISHDISPANKLKNIFYRVSEDDLVGDMLEEATTYLQETSSYLSRASFDKAVQNIIRARKLFVFAPGPSEGLGALLRFRLNRFDVTVQPMPRSGHELFEALVNITSEDVVVMFSFVDMLPETKVILDYATKAKYTTIAITDLLVSDLNKRADIVLYVARGQLWEFHSMVAPTAIVESMIIAIGLQLQERSLVKLESLQSLRKQYAGLIPK